MRFVPWVLVCGLLVAPAAAQETEPEPIVVEVEEVEEVAPLRERLELSGFVDLYYAFNDNDPADRENFYPGYGNVAKRADEFGLNLVGLDVLLPPEPIGFHVTVAAGNEMEILKLGEPEGETVGRDTFRHVYQATISYATGLGRGLLVEGGLYQGHVGFESPLPKDNWSYTQAWTGNLTPSYQTGIKLVYPFTDTVSGELHLVNGWQITGDNNDGKSFGTKLAWAPEWGSLTLNTWYGPELPSNDDDVRTLLDLVATVNATDRLQLAFEGILGEQERPDPLGGQRRLDDHRRLGALRAHRARRGDAARRERRRRRRGDQRLRAAARRGHAHLRVSPAARAGAQARGPPRQFRRPRLHDRHRRAGARPAVVRAGRDLHLLREHAMYDAIYIAVAIAFYALTWVLVRFCDRLEEKKR